MTTPHKHAAAGTPHVHAALIKAWADGAVIQVHNGRTWADLDRTPTWNIQNEYRIKPEITTSLTKEQLYDLYITAPRGVAGGSALVQGLCAVADAAIKQYIKENTK